MDYARWSELLDDPSWNYETFLNYFKKSELFTRTNNHVPIDEKFHGYSGELHTTQAFPPQNISSAILRGCQQLGYNITDYNGKEMFGCSISQIYSNHGIRSDSGSAFIEPIKNRKNLKVLDKSYVTKLVISKSSKKVKGVIFTRNNKTFIAKNRKEVILSAGSISSPHILLLSGIGPKEHLNSLKIPVVRDLPVGQNLLDHPLSFLVFSTNISNTTESLEESASDFLQGEGSLTRISLFDAVTFFRTPVEPNEHYPNVEFMFANFSGAAVAAKYFRWSDETFRALDANVPNPLAFEIFLLRAKSQGSVTLKSANPFDYPIIDFNILSDEENDDIESLYQAIQLALKLIQTEAFRRLNVTLAVKQFPGCEDEEPLSKEFWYCYIRRATSMAFHSVGTCATGTSPSTGVVDKELKVFGVKRLRVADSSVIPFTPTAHLNSVCVAIGEKAADMIKNSHE